jgi:hypothetical protein
MEFDIEDEEFKKQLEFAMQIQNKKKKVCKVKLRHPELFEARVWELSPKPKATTT